MQIELGSYQPMEPIKREDVFDSDDFIYQLKWDGVRILAGMAGDKVYLLNKKGNERSKQFPELQRLPVLLAADSAVLDGEIVVLRGGKPSFPAVMQRDRADLPLTIELYTQTLPIAYMVFDLIYLNGKDLRNKSLLERIALLENQFTDQDYLYHVQRFAQGSSLFAAVQKAGLEGIVAKRKNSVYHPGKQHKDWYKIKCRRNQKCLVGGYTLNGQQVNSLLLGVFREGQLRFAGKAANGLNAVHWQMLTTQLPSLEISSSPFADAAPKEAHFIQPQLAVLVEFLEWTEALHLRFPVIKAFINADASDCQV